MLKCKYVCFDCRLSFKQRRYNAPKAKCPECGNELTNIGYKAPVPKKSQIKKWKNLREWFFGRLREIEYYDRTEGSDWRKTELIRRLIKP